MPLLQVKLSTCGVSRLGDHLWPCFPALLSWETLMGNQALTSYFPHLVVFIASFHEEQRKRRQLQTGISISRKWNLEIGGFKAIE